MKKRIQSVLPTVSFARNPSAKRRPFILTLLALAAATVSAVSPARAGNILINPSFEDNSQHVIPLGWTRFEPPTAESFGNYWIEDNVPAHSGTQFWKQWGASYLPFPTNNVAGVYQDFSSAPGSVYEASGWFYTLGTPAGETLGPNSYTWVEVAFLGASSNVLALFKSDNFAASDGTDAWLHYSVTNACDLTQPVSVGDPYFTTYAVTGSVSQLAAPLGTTTVRYRYAYLQAGTESGSAYFDDALLDQISGPIPPVISSLFPLNMIFVDPSDGITFNVSSPSGFTISTNDIELVVNAVDVSGALAISGSSSNRNVAYYGLQSNLTYTVSITVTDSFNFTANANTYFETTWVGIEPVTYLWEAEDFDFSNGMYLNNPDLCNTNGNPNCYFGKVGVEGVDEHNLFFGPSHQYRPADPMGTAVSGDYLRKNLYLAGRPDYKIDPFNSDEWVNYTRDWPASTNWIVARLATGEGLSGSLTLSRVNPDTTTTDLGTFTVVGGLGWSTFDNVYLKDANGFLANVILNGTETLRLTSGGNLLPGCFMLVDAIVDQPRLSDLYPSGNNPFEYTNTLSFTAATTGATFPPGGISLNLDGSDVSSNLVITGSASTQDVVYAGLKPNALHTAIITVTNSLNHGISLAYSFDTFSQTNFMVEAEDFDYDGGQFITPWFPEAYGFLYGILWSTTNVDFHHSPFLPEKFEYRINGIPQDDDNLDTPRDVFINTGSFDYNLTWFGDGDWANYTRVYPAGNYYVYGRFSGLGDYSMYLDQVISGAGTTNQVTTRLGRWGFVGRGYSLFDWVPLTDDGLEAPVVVTLNGLGTLRIATTGNSNPNYFMLVPASGITFTETARSGNDFVGSFSTQSGVIHKVFYRDTLTDGNWGFLTNVVGDGTVKSVSDPATAATRFYRAD